MPTTCAFTPENLAAAGYCQNNMSGVKRLYTCPLADITAQNIAKAATFSGPEDFVKLVTPTAEKAYTCGTGKGFAKIYVGEDLGQLDYEVQGTKGCRSLKAKLNITHPGLSLKAIGTLTALLNVEIVAVAELNNGEYHFLGDLERGATIADDSAVNSGKAVADQNGVVFSIEWNTLAPCIADDAFSAEDATTGLPLIATT